MPDCPSLSQTSDADIFYHQICITPILSGSTHFWVGTEKVGLHDQSEDAAEDQEGIPDAVNGMSHAAADDQKQASGAPSPLLPHLITMSMLPKAQWQNLIHLDAIKVIFRIFYSALGGP